MAIFPFPLVPHFKKIQKLVGDPGTTIKKWLFEKKKIITIDPIKNKKKRENEKTIGVNKLQKLLMQIMEKVDEIIDHLDGIELLERMIIAEVKVRMELIAFGVLF